MFPIKGLYRNGKTPDVNRYAYDNKKIEVSKHMALSEFEIKRCEKSIANFLTKHRPPAHVRKMLDLGYRMENQSVLIIEIRPHWKNHSEKIKTPVAKATFVKTQKIWKVYWKRVDLKWHSYKPLPTTETLDEFLNEVGKDQHACFFG